MRENERLGDAGLLCKIIAGKIKRMLKEESTEVKTKNQNKKAGLFIIAVPELTLPRTPPMEGERRNERASEGIKEGREGRSAERLTPPF